jgi:hypothetical protein
VEVVSLRLQDHQTKLQVGTNGKWKAAPEQAKAGKLEAHAVLEYVMTGLNEALLTELLEGFHERGREE